MEELSDMRFGEEARLDELAPGGGEPPNTFIQLQQQDTEFLRRQEYWDEQLAAAYRHTDNWRRIGKGEAIAYMVAVVATTLLEIPVVLSLNPQDALIRIASLAGQAALTFWATGATEH